MRVYAALIALSLIWGLSFVFISILGGPAGVWGTVFIRCTAGALRCYRSYGTSEKILLSRFPGKYLS